MYKLLLAVVLPVFLFTSALTAQTIIPEGAKLEKVFNGGFSLEGPAEAPDGSIYFSDQTFTEESGMEAGHIWRYNPATGKTVIFRSPSGMSNGIKFNKAGNMVIAEGADYGGRCIISTDMETGKSKIIAGLFNGKPFNSPNDLCIDEHGKIYFTDPRYTGHELIEQPAMGVYRIDTNGTVSLLIGDIGMPNGIAISPDGKFLFVGCFDEGTESKPSSPGYRPRKMAILEYNLNVDGSAQFKRTFIDYGELDGPDGITFDNKGSLYAAVRNEASPGIYVYDIEGKQIGYIAVPEVPSNITFTKHSPKNYLYITAGKSLYRIEVLNKGL